MFWFSRRSLQLPAKNVFAKNIFVNKKKDSKLIEYYNAKIVNEIYLFSIRIFRKV